MKKYERRKLNKRKIERRLNKDTVKALKDYKLYKSGKIKLKSYESFAEVIKEIEHNS